MHTLTQLFWTNVLRKTQCGKTGAAGEDFIIQQFSSTTGCQTGLPIDRQIYSTSSEPSVGPTDLCVSLKAFTSA